MSHFKIPVVSTRLQLNRCYPIKTHEISSHVKFGIVLVGHVGLKKRVSISSR